MGKHAIAPTIIIALVALLALMLSIANAAPAATPAQQVEFTKTASNSTPRVGQTLTFTLYFGNLSSGTLEVGVTDQNPAASYLRILTPTITGGAIYSPTVSGSGPEGVVWTGLLTGTAVISPPLVFTVTYQVQVTGIPAPALATGYPIINTAVMVDLGVPGSLPLGRAEARIRIVPWRAFLPLVSRDYHITTAEQTLTGKNVAQFAKLRPGKLPTCPTSALSKVQGQGRGSSGARRPSYPYFSYNRCQASLHKMSRFPDRQGAQFVVN